MGEGATHPAGLFSTRELAEQWILRHQVTGVLTRYPMDQALYDWAIAEGHFAPKFPSQQRSEFVQRFTSAYAEHYHYVDGIEAGA